MTSFKVKNKVKKKVNTRVTLDALHNTQMSRFEHDESKLKKLKMNLLVMKNKYKKLDSVPMKTLQTSDIELKLNIKDTIQELTDEIAVNETQSEKTNYFLENGNLLFKYYSIGDTPSIANTMKHGNNKKTVMEYFKDSTTQDSIIKESELYLSKANIYDRYMSNTDENFVLNSDDSIKNIDMCLECNSEKTLYISNGKMICNICGEETSIIIDSDKPSYKDPPREVSYFAYKRINHFNEWLAQFQAKESTDIPKDVYDSIILELKKERIIDMELLTPKNMREILKKLKQNKYYEHIPHIINKLNGIPPPVMSRETEEELRRMFKEIQIPFHNFCPPNRKNFLSYSYVLHKFVQLLELDVFLKCFILLKSREKLHQQDQIWKDICAFLKWQFIPSI